MKKKTIISVLGVLGVLILSGSGDKVQPPKSIEEHHETQQEVKHEVNHTLQEKKTTDPISDKHIVIENKENTHTVTPKTTNKKTKKVIPAVHHTSTLQQAKKNTQQELKKGTSITKEQKKNKELPAPVDKNGPYYTSSHYRAKYYYPKACSQWKELSPKYLRSYPTVDELLKHYSREIHPNCL